MARFTESGSLRLYVAQHSLWISLLRVRRNTGRALGNLSDPRARHSAMAKPTQKELHMMKSLSTLLAFATIVGLAECASDRTPGASGASAHGASPRYTQCPPEFAVACRS